MPISSLEISPAADMHLLNRLLAKHALTIAAKQLCGIHRFVPIAPQCCQVVLDIIHLRAWIESDMGQLLLCGYALFKELLDYHVTDLLERGVVLILDDINIEHA